MLEERQENTVTEADRLAQIIRTADGNHDMGAGALAEAIADSGFLYEIRADERAKLQDRIEELEKNLSYEVEQKIKLADTLRDERAKRPDREQIETIIADGVNTLTAEQLRELFIDPVAIANDVFAAFEGGRDV